MRASQIKLGVVLLLAAGCRDVLGIHAANGGFDAGMNPATDSDSAVDGGLQPTPADGGDGTGTDIAGQAGTSGERSAGTSGSGGSGGSSGSSGSGGASGSGGTAVSNPAAGSGGNAGSGGAGPSAAGAGGAGSGGSSGSGGMAGASGAGTAGGPSCSDVCSLGDTQCISSTEVQACGLVDGCLVWTTITPCGERQMCHESGTTASCSCQPPPAGCESGSGSFCASDTRLETCAADADGCTYELAPTTCPAGKPCSGTHPSASCSCDEPSDCHGVVGGVCRSAAQVVTCARNPAGCLAISATESCPSGTSCSGAAGGASCKCPAPPAICMGASSGNVCQSDTSFAQCSSDSNGCVSATLGACNALQPCRGGAGSADCTCLNPPTSTQCPAGMDDGARCSGSSLLRCGNDVAGCQRFSQTACDSGVCGGSYPSAACVSEQELGWPTDLGNMQEHGTGALAGTKISLPATAVLRRFGIISRTAGTHAILALYDDQAGLPHNRVAATNNSTLVAGVNEFAVALPPSQVTLSAGTYWLMLSVDATTQIAGGSASVPLAYVSYSHGGPVPSPLTSVASDDVMPEANFYIVVLPQ